MWRSTDVVTAIRQAHARVVAENVLRNRTTSPILADHMGLPAHIKYDMHTRQFDHIQSLFCFRRIGSEYFVARYYCSPNMIKVHPKSYTYEVTYDPRESTPADYPTDDQLYVTLNKKLQNRDCIFEPIV